jgi:hypothetical protein
MNPWIGKTAFLLGMVIFVAIRVPHDKRSKETKIAESRKGDLEATLLALMGIGGFVFPLIYILPPLFSFADYALYCHFWAASCVSDFHFGYFTGRMPIWAQTGPTVWKFAKTIKW